METDTDSPSAHLGTLAAECKRQGAPERLLKPLASAVAYEVFGAPSRWSEALPQVEAALNGGGVA